jgi:predicted transcriptional regulator
LENEVLAALWSADGALTAGEVQEQVPGDLAYTTVMTILARLHEKGVIERAKVGRAFAYRPVVAESDAVAQQVREMLDHSGDRRAALLGLVAGLEPGEEAVLRELLSRAEGQP